jgi:heptosyltransferase-1
MKVLIVKTSSMGDVIHTFQAVEDVRRHRPDVALDWCVEEAFADIVALHPAIGTIHATAMRRWRRAPLRRRTRAEVLELRRRLKAGAYDLVIDAQGLLKSAFVARLAGVPIAGYDRASAREPAASIVYRHRFDVARGLHAVERTRRLFGLALGYTPDLADLATGISAPALRPGIELPARPAFLLHGTSRADKKWPVEQWIATARLLLERGLAPLTTFSSPDERAVAAGIAAAVPGTKVIGRSPLREVAALLGRCELVIGADTGLTHLASAFGLPTVAVFLSTTPGLTGPVGPYASTIAAGPGRPVAAEDVMGEADRLLAARAQPKRTSTIS